MGSPSAVLVTMDRTHKRSHTGQKLKSGSLLDAIASKVCQPSPSQRCSYPKRKCFDSYLMRRLTHECHTRGETRLIKSGKCLTRPSKVIIRPAKHKTTPCSRVYSGFQPELPVPETPSLSRQEQNVSPCKLHQTTLSSCTRRFCCCCCQKRLCTIVSLCFVALVSVFPPYPAPKVHVYRNGDASRVL